MKDFVNVFVYGFPQEIITEEMLKKEFSRFGEVQHVKIVKDKKTGSPKKYALVTMTKEEEAEKAIKALNDFPIGENKLVVRLSDKQDKPAHKEEKKPNSLFVYRFPHKKNSKKKTKDILREEFSKYGKVKAVNIEKTKNYAFIHMPNKEEAENAVKALHGFKLGKKHLIVKFSDGGKPKKKEEQPKDIPTQEYSDTKQTQETTTNQKTLRKTDIPKAKEAKEKATKTSTKAKKAAPSKTVKKVSTPPTKAKAKAKEKPAKLFVVTSYLKKYLNDKGTQGSAQIFPYISKLVIDLCDQAIKKVKESKRKIVQTKDFE